MLTRNGSGYTALPTPVSPIDRDGTIQSGAAFIVDFTGAGSLAIHESDKLTGSAQVFRMASISTATAEEFRTNLYVYNNDGTVSLEDGALVLCDNSFSNNLDLMDLRKMVTAAENIWISRESKTLSVERRQVIATVIPPFLP